MARTSGVTSKSAPAPINSRPGFTKLDCPSSFDERRLARMPLRPESATPPPPINGTAWRIQKLVSAPANCGFSRIASKPVAFPSKGSLSADW